MKNINTYDAAYLIRTHKFFWNEHEYLNGEIKGKNPFVCCKCNTNLLWNYQEDETYLIKCPTCKIISIVQATSPYMAMGKVGR